MILVLDMFIISALRICAVSCDRWQGFPQVPERDTAGNVIPSWKRQMLARRAAEKARKDLEKELAGEAERRRAAAVPAWKRQLLQRREEAENRLRQSLYTPKVEDTNGHGLPNGEWRAYPSGATRAVSIDNISLCYDTPQHPIRAPSEANMSTTEQCNGTSNGKN
ncbi:putative forked protein [Operophtera brumata]|uniref:Putative forked protein n=1 Tax=Operophtera brumata TaxID=104452 RepID=A0A0L7L7L6_OPEBR|nr:putative forked protein [Operophtera brumata]